MNYRIFLSGYRFATYDDCIKLLIYSAEKSDYIVEITGFERTTPFSPAKNYILLKGSSKEIYCDIIIDFDELLTNSNTNKAIVISPSTLDIDPSPNGFHYWKSIGAVFKIISDLSPAYVTGHLLEKHMEKELESFNSSLSTLPFSIQIAFNELMTDI